jgi:hypothetical protein
VVLVTLGGGACDSVEARKKIVRFSKGRFMRGIVLTRGDREEQL